MTHVFVSGCYDILHAGHVQFFREARALGDFLTVCFASNDVLWNHKARRSSLPDDHKLALLESFGMIDKVVIGDDPTDGLDFETHFRRLRPDILAVTDDDKYEDVKRALCAEVGARYVRLPKTPPQFQPVSTSGLVKWIRAPQEAPLRIDFGGGWLDVPRFAREGAYIVNVAISPTVTLRNWPYHRQAGLGGSGAWALLTGQDGVASELDLGVGWQDPAVVRETGLCVWRSGLRPSLEIKTDGAMLRGRLAVLWTGVEHDTPGLADRGRDFDQIEAAGRAARDAVWASSLEDLARAVAISYEMQMGEGMNALPVVPGALSRKYCGGGFGGYAAYVFADPADRDRFVGSNSDAMAVEPFIRTE